MELKQASRKKSRIRISLGGPSGSGKTYSSLLLASGMAPWEKIAVIDTERGSADLYSHLGPYNTLTLPAPFSPERYIEAIKTCEDAGMEVIIIDSITHEWEGVGGILQTHESMQGNSFTNWAKLTPRHNAFIDAILQSKSHVICCVRSKQDYVINDKNGKKVPEKIGMKAVTREGFDYEVTIGFDLDLGHNANCTKDRTGLFMKSNQASFPFVISSQTGKAIMDWCNNPTAEATPQPPSTENKSEIKLAKSNNNDSDKEDLETVTVKMRCGELLEEIKNATTDKQMKAISKIIKEDKEFREVSLGKLRKAYQKRMEEIENKEVKNG